MHSAARNRSPTRRQHPAKFDYAVVGQAWRSLTQDDQTCHFRGHFTTRTDTSVELSPTSTIRMTGADTDLLLGRWPQYAPSPAVRHSGVTLAVFWLVILPLRGGDALRR